MSGRHALVTGAASGIGRACAESFLQRGAAVIGFAEWDRDCFNSAAVVADGRVQAVYRKRFLPNYGVFDEKRLYAEGPMPGPVEIAGCRIGFPICEDIWYREPAEKAKEAGAEILVNLNASPFHKGKSVEREELVAKRAQETGLPVVYVAHLVLPDEVQVRPDDRPAGAGPHGRVGDDQVRPPEVELDHAAGMVAGRIGWGYMMAQHHLRPLIVLSALARLDPEDALLPNAVRWLMVARKEGHWETTQETAWALICKALAMSAWRSFRRSRCDLIRAPMRARSMSDSS